MLFLNLLQGRATCLQRIHWQTPCLDSISQRRQTVAYRIPGEAAEMLVLCDYIGPL
jgi:hypothetical protein